MNNTGVNSCRVAYKITVFPHSSENNTITLTFLASLTNLVLLQPSHEPSVSPTPGSTCGDLSVCVSVSIQTVFSGVNPATDNPSHSSNYLVTSVSIQAVLVNPLFLNVLGPNYD